MKPGGSLVEVVDVDPSVFSVSVQQVLGHGRGQLEQLIPMMRAGLRAGHLLVDVFGGEHVYEGDAQQHLRVVHGEGPRDAGAAVMRKHDAFFDPQLPEQRMEVLRLELLGHSLHLGRLLGQAVSTIVGHNQVMVFHQLRGDPAPHHAGLEEPVHEDQRLFPVAALMHVEHPDPVYFGVLAF
jgi:hypothetical protein